jgi:electron transport complex protein RnfG
MSEHSIAQVSTRTALILLVFTLAFTALMALTYLATKAPIEASANDEKLKLINEVLPRDLYDNDLLTDFVELGPTAQLGLDVPTRAFRARKAGQAAAVVLEAVAPDGYSGKINLLVAVSAGGEVVGVRVTLHKETPGLGDYIDIAKDKNKAKPWVRQFDGLGFDKVVPAEWKVRKDGGRFDSRAGATISARAVTRAVGRALEFAGTNRDRLFSQPPGAKL